MIRKRTDIFCAVVFSAGIAGMLSPSQNAGPGLRSVQEFWNLGHAVLFFLMGHLIYSFSPGLFLRRLRCQALVLGASVLAAGSVIELVQAMIPGRFPSFSDILVNLGGAGIYLFWKNRNKTGKKTIPYAAIACIIALISWPFVRAVSDDITAIRQFPVLADFETPFEASRFKSDTADYKITSQRAFHGKHSLRLRLDADNTYSGIFLHYMPRNWQSFSRLGFAVYNPQSGPIRLTARIHDTAHENLPSQQVSDRFNKSFLLTPQTWTEVEIDLTDVRHAPLERQMDLKEIFAFGVFVTNPAKDTTLFFDRIVLK